ncbi:MAG: flagellar biosynthesis protein FlhF [Nannocystaceae bacterium]
MPDVRTFQAREIKEALALVRRDLGPQAVILGTRRVPGRALGLLGGSFIEVRASPGGDDEACRPTPRTSTAAEQAPTAVANRHKALLALSRARRRQTVNKPDKSLHDQITASPDSALAAATGGPDGTMSPHASLRRRLLAGLVPRPLCESWLAQIPNDISDRNAESRISDFLIGLLGPNAPLVPPTTRVAAFVGPTGVGKTTTIAKLAARAKLVDDRRVALVTLDDARIGATAQLGAYADLLGLPFHVCGRQINLARTLAGETEADLILVDTAGAPTNQLSELASLNQRIHRAGEPVAVHLCIAAATRKAELDRILHVYRPFPTHALLATKLDEAVAVGSMFAARLESELPFSYVTTGQQVPDDLAPATPTLLVEALLGDKHP